MLLDNRGYIYIFFLNIYYIYILNSEVAVAVHLLGTICQVIEYDHLTLSFNQNNKDPQVNSLLIQSLLGKH